MLKYRVLTIFILVPIVIWLIFLAPLSLKRAVLGVLMLLALWEWCGLSFPLARIQQAITLVVLVALAVATHFTPIQYIVWGASTFFWLLISPYWLRQHWQCSPFLRLLLGSGLIVSLFSSMAYLVHQSPLFFLTSMAMIWVSDIMAYITGRLLGRNKLAPSISPGKTWEGVWGGLVSSVIYTAIVSMKVFDQHFSWQLLCVAAVLAAYGVLGDLWESLLKRQAGKKDSGQLLPGHGGILDRIDALFPVLPAVALIYALGEVGRHLN